MVVLIAYRHGYKGLPGSFCPRTLSDQCVAGDLSNHPKLMVSHGFHLKSSASVIGTFALCVMSSARFVAAGLRESDYGMSTVSVFLMF